MEVKHKTSDRNGTFSLQNRDKEIGEMTYVFVGDKTIDINHTLIEEEFRGKDFGLKLIEASVEFMRANQLKAIPTCPYVKKVLDETLDYNDIIA